MVKDKVLEILESHKGIRVSGQDIADKLSITRSAVWKAINMLRAEGYDIPATTNNGYLLVEENDIITEQSIMPYIRGAAKKYSIIVKNRVGSTNSELKKLAAAIEYEKEGLVLIANEQTAGRGRLGRSFYSPADSGIYMSVLLRPDLKPKDAMIITAVAAVSAARAIEKRYGIKVGIKWVNDLYYKGKKVAGILTEGGINIENGMLDYVVLGIGVNIFTEVFPDEIKDTAGSLFERKTGRSRLAAEILNHLAVDLKNPLDKSYISEYRERSVILGNEIYVLKNGRKIPAVAVGIEDNARLAVRYKDGKTEVLSSDEISIKRR